MSSEKSNNSEKNLFIERFIEVCNASQPTEVARLLNISYQAAKNYLHGRHPETKVLVTICKKTPYSINWLLTGEGDKFTKTPLNKHTPPVSDQIKTFVREICLEVIGEVLASRDENSHEKKVILTPEKIRTEKVSDKSAVFSENEDK